MKKISVLFLVFLFVAAGCSFYSQGVQNSPVTPAQKPAEQNWKTNAEGVVSSFVENFVSAAINHNTNFDYTKLSISAQATVKKYAKDSSLDRQFAGLTHFVSVQDVPDKGVTIQSSEKLQDGTVKVITKWNYSGMSSPVTKTFILVEESKQWKIDKIQ